MCVCVCETLCVHAVFFFVSARLLAALPCVWVHINVHSTKNALACVYLRLDVHGSVPVLYIP